MSMSQGGLPCFRQQPETTLETLTINPLCALVAFGMEESLKCLVRLLDRLRMLLLLLVPILGNPFSLLLFGKVNLLCECPH